MADPWLTLIGLGEDGLPGLSEASRTALRDARHVFGASRHLNLAGVTGTPWPVPFSTAPLLACRGDPSVALVSGDPFWFGAGSTLMADLENGEWIAHPAPSCFQWIAARLGWRMERVSCLGLHAAPFEHLLPELSPGARVMATLRDGAAARDLATWLCTQGYGASVIHVCEAVGGARERIRQTRATAFAIDDVEHPVAVALDLDGPARPVLPGRPVGAFQNDGQISKPHVRALTVMALAPYPGAHLWDLGAGSGAISVEWCRAAARTSAVAMERSPDRARNIAANAAAFGVSKRLKVRAGVVPDVLPETAPDAVFLGGGASAAVIAAIWERLPKGARMVANAVTLETEALLIGEQATRGGTLTRIDIAEAAPLGTFRGWQSARPVVQWQVVR